ncbi:hypothetical protein GCM10022234_00010 [Aeromicrobium panaciterrae]|uniref:hypothetical protein n=1 Tax=Aeromicrobium panaciterrae TaxID=363861 RepID=UPI0031D43533
MSTSTLHAVIDPDFGSISAVVDRDGTILSTGAASPALPATDVRPYLEAARLVERELSELMRGDHLIDPEVWERCIHRGWVDSSDDVH